MTPNPCPSRSNSFRLFPSRQISTSSQPQGTSAPVGLLFERGTDLVQILTCRDFSNKELEHLNRGEGGREGVREGGRTHG